MCRVMSGRVVSRPLGPFGQSQLTKMEKRMVPRENSSNMQHPHENNARVGEQEQPREPALSLRKGARRDTHERDIVRHRLWFFNDAPRARHVQCSPTALSCPSSKTALYAPSLSFLPPAPLPLPAPFPLPLPHPLFTLPPLLRPILPPLPRLLPQSIPCPSPYPPSLYLETQRTDRMSAGIVLWGGCTCRTL